MKRKKFIARHEFNVIDGLGFINSTTYSIRLTAVRLFKTCIEIVRNQKFRCDRFRAKHLQYLKAHNIMPLMNCHPFRSTINVGSEIN